jgi:uncharacterized membrane protein YkoI
MKRRTALMIAAALTAFVLVLLGAVAGQLIAQRGDTAQAAGPESGATQPQPAAAPSDTPQSEPVSPERAIQQALAVAPPNAQPLRAPELVDLQGTVAYEVPFADGNVYIDATTGQVLSSSLPTRRRDDHDSDRRNPERHEQHDVAEHYEND